MVVIYIYIYIYIYILAQFVCHATHVAFCHMYIYSMLYTIDYILYGPTMGMVHGTNILPLFFSPFLLLLLLIYDGVGTYNETAIVD